MLKQMYVALVEKDRETYGVTFPDFPGCTSAGDTAEAAAEGAVEALAGHIAAMAADGDGLPEPGFGVDQDPDDPEVNVVAKLLISVPVPGRTKRINVMLDESLIAEIDAVTNNRSRFLSEAARAELARRA